MKYTIFIYLFIFPENAIKDDSVKSNRAVQEAGGALLPQLEEGSNDWGTEGAQTSWAHITETTSLP